MSAQSRHGLLRGTIGASVLAVVAAPLAVLAPAEASPSGDQVVISEVYVNGGSAGAPYTNKFIELFNPTDNAVSLASWSLQYRPATNTAPFGSVTNLTGSIPAGGHYLIGGSSNGATGAALPTPDVVSTLNPANGGGTFALVNSQTALNPGTGSITGNAAVVDLVGWGNSNTFETAAGPAPTATSDARSLNRAASGADTDSNAADFTLSATVTPQNTGLGPVDPGEPTEAAIAEIQGTGADSPMAGDQVITRGVVTAAYPTGGFNGFYIQTEGSGGTPDATPGASDGIFVFGSAFVGLVEIGDFVEVTGAVSEFNGLTEITPSTDGVEVLTDPAQAIKDSPVAYPASNSEREALEGMLIQPQGAFTVTDNFNLNNFGEIGLAAGTKTLKQPTDVALPLVPGGDNSAYEAVVAENAAKRVALDDGSSTNYLGNPTNKAIPLPWLEIDKPIRVGAAVTFTKPVIIDYRNNAWKFQPTSQLTAANDASVAPATFADNRPSAPRDVGGDVTLASFNVLNYFTETGADYEADGGSCDFFTDRENNPITVDDCGEVGPRGAADDTNLARQQAKIVNAINTLDADVLSLEEIENSSRYADSRDAALSALVDALNEDAGADRWAFVPSPAAVPADEDVIRTAFIYQKADIRTVGDSEILIDPVFDNARAPLAQAFMPVGGAPDSEFVAIVNHFKSKSSGSGDDADQNDGQGASNYSRTLQAAALATFAADFSADAGTDTVFLLGDFNAYTMEDPMRILYQKGYTDLGRAFAGEDTYLFGGLVGSLDHVLVSDAAFDDIVDADVWNINSVEPVALEYSRYNYNVTDFYDESPFRSSDHDPLIVGFDVPPAPSTLEASVADTVYGTAPKIDVTVSSHPVAVGRVQVREGTRLLGAGTLQDGKVAVKLGRFALKPGAHTLTVSYAGNDEVAASSTTVMLTVNRVAPTLTSTVSPAKIVVKKSKATVTVTVSSDVVTPTGRVLISRGGTVLATGNLSSGVVGLTLPAFTTTGSKTILISYAGDSLVLPAATDTTINVVKK